MNNMFMAMLAAATARVEVPVDGSTGVWIKEGATVISSGMKMAGAVVSSGATQTLYTRGLTTSNIILTGGRMNVSSGGTATGAKLSAGWGYIYAGGLTSGAIVYANARMYVLTGAVTSNDAMSAGLYYVSSGGTAAGLTVSNGNAYGHANGTASGAICKGGALNLVAGKAYDTTVDRNGRINISANASASGVIVSSGGRLEIFSGGTALAVVSSAGAIVNVAEGGYIEYA